MTNNRWSSTLQSIPVGVDVPTEVRVDSGCYRAAAGQAVEQSSDGTPSGITVYASVEKTSHYRTAADLGALPDPAPPGSDAVPTDHLRHLLRTKVGRAK